MHSRTWVYERSADAILAELGRIGWSQRELARHLNVSEGTVSGWVNAHTLPDYYSHLHMSFYFGWSHPALPTMETGPDGPGVYLAWHNPDAPTD